LFPEFVFNNFSSRETRHYILFTIPLTQPTLALDKPVCLPIIGTTISLIKDVDEEE
jgi:hypothetical protein